MPGASERFRRGPAQDPRWEDSHDFAAEVGLWRFDVAQCLGLAADVAADSTDIRAVRVEAQP